MEYAIVAVMLNLKKYQRSYAKTELFKIDFLINSSINFSYGEPPKPFPYDKIPKARIIISRTWKLRFLYLK